MGEVKKQHSLTHLSIGEAHSTWEARLRIDDHSSSTDRL